MTNQDVYNYINDNVQDHQNNTGEEYIADEYVKEGYGQVKGDYLTEAYIQNKELNWKKAEPSQKWHLCTAYLMYKDNHKDEFPNFEWEGTANFGRLCCPQLMLWIAEVAGLKREIVEKAMKNAIKYEKCHDTKDSRKIKQMVLKEGLRWREICKVIQEEKEWEEVIATIEKLG